MAKHKPDYQKIAALERELGMAPAMLWDATAGAPAPASVPSVPQASPLPPPIQFVPDDALYRCHACGNRIKAGASACNHCGSQEWRRDED